MYIYMYTIQSEDLNEFYLLTCVLVLISCPITRTTSEDSSSSDNETDSSSESDVSTTIEDEDEDSAEDGIPISATKGDGVDVLWDRIQEKVLQATDNKHIVFTVPSDGPQLRQMLTFNGLLANTYLT